MWIGFFAIVGLHAFGTVNYIYKTVWWFDIFMHGAGGFWVAGCAYILAGLKRLSKSAIWGILAFTLGVGIAWEIFEITVDVFIPLQFGNMAGDPYDTAGDLIMDIVGAAVFIKAFLLFTSMKIKDLLADFFVEKEVRVQRKIATVPNAITAAGIALTIFYIFMYATEWNTPLIPVVVGLAVVSDMLDGLAARKLDQHTVLGKDLDPLRDRMLEFAVIGNILLISFSLKNAIIVLLICIVEALIFGIKRKMRKSKTSGGFTHTIAKVRLMVHMLCAGIFIVGAYWPFISFGWLEFFTSTVLLLIMLIASQMALGAYAKHNRSN